MTDPPREAMLKRLEELLDDTECVAAQRSAHNAC